MFRQIRVHPEDTHLQRILWRLDPAAEVQDFYLLTVVYSTASAPYFALRVLIQLADDEGKAYSLGAKAIKQNSYMDDFYGGGHTVEEALETLRQLVAILRAGGFELSKWAANTPELCPDGESTAKLLHDREGVSTLGVLWSPADDRFALRVAPPTRVSGSTKRSVLSDVARFFDPLGWAAPVLIFGKIFIQDLWMAGLDWDQPLPEGLQSSWTKFTETLPHLNALSVPRSVGYKPCLRCGCLPAVHGRIWGSFCPFGGGKDQGGPGPTVTIPRLELQGALLLAELLDATGKGLDLSGAQKFLHNTRNPRNKKEGFVTRDELDAARLRWVRIAQRHDFPDEIAQLGDSRPLPARSLLPFEEKHPLILAKDNPLFLLLVREAHMTSLHGGPQLTRSLLLRRVWILRANSLIRAVIHKCVTCAQFRGATAAQQMGQLPAERARPGRPFQSAGVDYAGPVFLRTTKGRGHKAVKGYICLFVCLSSKAIHLEAVSDLFSASFLAAFKRFTARRGHCRLLMSDNGTNFRGAAKELRAMFKAASSFYHASAADLANHGTEWSFISPGAPHFGGLWEAGVKSVKYHLRRVLGEHKLTFEEMATLLSQVEACLNSRLLYALSNDPSDLSALPRATCSLASYL
ncbi:uncharacterized protein [Temnothorax longispinosus]|uniref:uncharacterized protein n=1 Tax=Temnothorax longispinosus TaxID=300112 RepID=UPI003A9968D7